MNYYRPATEEDFKDFEVEFPSYRSMDDETKMLIEQGEIQKAVRSLREKYGFGLVESKKYCLKYQAFIKAREDFKQGKPVFVAY